jgi:HEAT repeat protein
MLKSLGLISSVVLLTASSSSGSDLMQIVYMVGMLAGIYVVGTIFNKIGEAIREVANSHQRSYTPRSTKVRNRSGFLPWILIGAVVGGLVSGVIGNNEEHNRKFPIAISYRVELEKQAEASGIHLDPWTDYLTSINDLTMDIFQAYNLGFTKEIQAKVSTKEIPQFIQSIPLEGVSAAKPYVDITRRLKEIKALLEQSWGEMKTDPYQNEFSGEWYSEPGHQDLGPGKQIEYHNIYHSDYNEDAGWRASSLFKKLFQIYPQLTLMRADPYQIYDINAPSFGQETNHYKVINDVLAKYKINSIDDHLTMIEQLTKAFNELISIPNLIELIHDEKGTVKRDEGTANTATIIANRQIMESIYPLTLRSSASVAKGTENVSSATIWATESYMLNDVLPSIMNAYNNNNGLREDAENWDKSARTAKSISFDKIERIEKIFLSDGHVEQVEPGPQPETSDEYKTAQQVAADIDAYLSNLKMEKVFDYVKSNNEDVKELYKYIKQYVSISTAGLDLDKSIEQDSGKLEQKIIDLSKQIYEHNFDKGVDLDLSFRNWVVVLFVLAGIAVGSGAGAIGKKVVNGLKGNISTGLSQAEEAQIRADIARGSDAVRDRNGGVVNVAKERSVQILEREQDLRSALKAKGVADNEIETAINALRNPEISFQWFTSKVFGKEKYFLGSESALAVDVINYLLEQEKATGASNLVNEYILHEALERTKLDHNEIIGLTQTFFNRPAAQTNGDTLLGQSLRKFISTALIVPQRGLGKGFKAMFLTAGFTLFSLFAAQPAMAETVGQHTGIPPTVGLVLVVIGNVMALIGLIRFFVARSYFNLGVTLGDADKLIASDIPNKSEAATALINTLSKARIKEEKQLSQLNKKKADLSEQKIKWEMELISARREGVAFPSETTIVFLLDNLKQRIADCSQVITETDSVITQIDEVLSQLSQVVNGSGNTPGRPFSPGKSPADAKHMIERSADLQNLLKKQGNFTLNDYLNAYRTLAGKMRFERLAANPKPTARGDLKGLIDQGYLKVEATGKGKAYKYSLTRTNTGKISISTRAKAMALVMILPIVSSIFSGYLPKSFSQFMAPQGIYAQDNANIDSLIKKLKNADPKVRSDTAVALGNMGPAAKDAVPVIIYLLKDNDQSVVQSAVEAINKIHTVSLDALPALIIALSDERWEVRNGAAWAIGLEPATKDAISALINTLKDSNKNVSDTATKELAIMGSVAIPALISAVKSENKQVRDRAIEALGYIGSAALPALFAISNDANVNADVRKAAADTIQKIQDYLAEENATVGALIQQLRDGNHVAAAEYQLSQLDDSAVPLLVKALKGSDDSVRFHIIAALCEMNPVSKAAVPTLIDALKDSNLNTRYYAAIALSTTGDIKDALPVISNTLNNMDALNLSSLAKDEALKELSSALGNIGPAAKDALPAIFAILNDMHSSVDTCKAASDAINKIQGTSIDYSKIYALTAQLRYNDTIDGDPDQILSAEKELIKIGGPAVPALLDILKETRVGDYISDTAMDALGNIGSAAKDALPALFAILNDTDSSLDVCKTVADAINKIQGTSVDYSKINELMKQLRDGDYSKVTEGELAKIGVPAVPALLNALKSDRYDHSNILLILWGINPLPKDAIPALINVLKDSNYNLTAHTIAACILGKTGDKKDVLLPATIDLLKESRKQGNDVDSKALISVFGLIGTAAKDALPILLEIYNDKNENADIREAAADAIYYVRGNSGNISTGLSQAEEAQVRADIALGSDELHNHNSDVVKIAKERSGKILEREQDLRGALKAKGVADNEIETAVNTLRNPETSFQWFTSKVFGKEKYFLGSESALAVDVINFLLEQEKATGATNLVNEYILHEALERTKLSHNEIIGLTQTFFNRPAAQTNGDTLLGQSLRGFINASNKPGRYLAVQENTGVKSISAWMKLAGSNERTTQKQNPVANLLNGIKQMPTGAKIIAVALAMIAIPQIVFAATPIVYVEDPVLIIAASIVLLISIFIMLGTGKKFVFGLLPLLVFIISGNAFVHYFHIKDTTGGYLGLALTVVYQVIAFIIYSVKFTSSIFSSPESKSVIKTSEAEDYFSQGNYGKSFESFLEIVKLDPQNADAWFRAGFILDNNGQYNDAIMFYDKTLELRPLHYNALNNKGLILYKMGRPEEAKACLEKAAGLGSVEAKNSLEYLSRPGGPFAPGQTGLKSTTGMETASRDENGRFTEKPGKSSEAAKIVLETVEMKSVKEKNSGYFTLKDYQTIYAKIYNRLSVNGVPFEAPSQITNSEDAFRSDLNKLVKQGYLSIDKSHKEDWYSVAFTNKSVLNFWDSVEKGVVKSIKNTDVRNFTTGWTVSSVVRKYGSVLQGVKQIAYSIEAGANTELAKKTMEDSSDGIIMKGTIGEKLCDVAVTVNEKGVDDTVLVSIKYAKIDAKAKKSASVFYIDYNAKDMSEDKEIAIEAGVAKALKTFYSDPDSFGAGSKPTQYVEASNIERMQKDMLPGSNSALMIDTTKIEHFEDVFKQISLMSEMGYDTLDIVSAEAMKPGQLKQLAEYAKQQNVSVVFEYKPANSDLGKALADVENSIRVNGLNGVVFNISDFGSVSEGFISDLRKAVDRSASGENENLVAVVLPQKASAGVVKATEKENVKVMYTHVVCKDQPVKAVGSNGCVRVVENADADALTVDLDKEATDRAGDEIKDVYEKSQAGFVFIELPLLYKGIKDGKISFVSKSKDLVDKIKSLIDASVERAKLTLTPEQQYRRGYKTGVKFAKEYVKEVGDQLKTKMVRYLRGEIAPVELVVDFMGITKNIDIIGELKDKNAQDGFVRSVLESMFILKYLDPKAGNLEYQNPQYTRLIGYFMAENAVHPTDTTKIIADRIMNQKKIVYNLVVDEKMKLDITSGLNPLVESMLSGTLKVEAIKSIDDTLKFLDLADRLIPELDTKRIGKAVVPGLTQAILGAA